MDVTYNHGKLLKVNWTDNDEPSRFTPFHKNEFIIGKTLLKVTFSDILVLQEASSILID